MARVARTYRDLMKVDCTGCDYCQPCPSGVDIAGCFESFNAYHTFGRTQDAAFLYALRMCGVMSGRPAYASLCSHCLDCLDQCPQSLPIPDLLEQVAAEFETADLPQRVAMVRRLFEA